MLWRSAVAALITATLALSAASQTVDRDHDPAAARAQDQARERDECKPRLIAAGRTKYRPLTLAREIRGEGAAMAGAIANWQRDANAQHGSQWMLWERAEERSFVCGPTRSGSVFCTLEARPCGGGPDKSPGEETEQVGKLCNEYSRARILGAQQWMNGCNACGRQIRIDGQCGPQTERCLRAFQSSRFGREQGLEVSAAPDRKTILALREFCQR
jgi:hypothetical protein